MKSFMMSIFIYLLPLTLWGMTPISDPELSDITGQAGVNINANLTMDISIGTMAWGDADGLASVYNPWDANGTTGIHDDSGGYIGIKDLNITNLAVKARTVDSWNGYTTLMLKPITIDVATTGTSGVVVTTAASNGPADAFHGGAVTENIGPGLTFVRFGLGSLVISMDSLQFDVNLGARANGPNATAGTTDQFTALNQNLGQVSLGGVAMAINPMSHVDIYQSQTSPGVNASGVAFAVNVKVDHFAADYLSWGDKDGLKAGNGIWFNGTDTTAGYIGLKDFQVNGPISINGTVAVDIITTYAGIYAQLPQFMGKLGDQGLK